jgi:hypothetical protein
MTNNNPITSISVFNKEKQWKNMLIKDKSL